MLLSDKYHFNVMYRDAIRFNKNSYVYELLQTNNFSPKAKTVLDKAKNLVYHSMAFREKYHLREPKYNLYAWDAGWYQLRLGVIQQVGKLNEELKLFNSYFKELEDEIREGVYKYGFLKK